MYHLVNANIDHLLATIQPPEDLAPYIWMLQELPSPGAIQSPTFQKTFSKYWAMNAAHLGAGFKAQYFEILLDESKHAQRRCDVETITKRLLEIDVNSKGKALEFSFATKLVHMLDPTLPVYDTRVESFYFLPRSYSGTHEVKLKNLLCSYDFLIREYARVLRDELLAPAISECRRRFNLTAIYTDQKVIDTLIWKFVPMLEHGAIRDGTVAYK